MSYNIHQDVANYLAVRNRNRALQDGHEPLPELIAPEPRPRWARLLAFLGSLAARRPRLRPRSAPRQIRPERG